MRILKLYPMILVLLVGVIGAWSLKAPRDLFIWWLEALPVLIALPLLLITFRFFRWTNLVYTMMALHAVILLIGAHYTYAEVPLFDYFREVFSLTRNHYDRLGHVVQGASPALIIRELLLRTSPLSPGKWLFALIVFSCLGISASYEIIEWLVAVLTGEAADAFLGTQGDSWDTQIDMFCAGIGAIFSLLFFSSWHNKQLFTSKNISHQ